MILIQSRWNFFLFLYALLNNMPIQIDKNLSRKFLLNPVGFGTYKEESRFDVVKYHPSYVEYLVNTSIDSGDEMGEQVRNMVIAFEMEEVHLLMNATLNGWMKECQNGRSTILNCTV